MLTFHTYADLFPLIEGQEFADLVADVAANGVLEPIWLFDGQILDGRNRYRASLEAGVEAPTRTYTGDDPLGFVLSLNIHRRHLSESQRAMVAAKIATLTHGQRQSGQLAAVPTQSDAAELLNVGERTVRRAREVIDKGAPTLAQAVEAGRVSVSAAAEVAALPQAEQAALVAAGEDEILRRAKEIRTSALPNANPQMTMSLLVQQFYRPASSARSS